MQLIRKKIPSNCNLFLFGDAHLGTILFDEDGFNHLIETMESEYDGIPPRHNFGIDHGDAIEAIVVDDKRYDAQMVDHSLGTPGAQAEAYAKLIYPIRKLLVCRLLGNHEVRLLKYDDFSERICKEIKRPEVYGTYSAKITYVDKDDNLILKHFAVHGRKGISTIADDPQRRRSNMHLALKRHLKHKTGDCLLMSKGHTHRLLVCEPQSELYLTDDGRKIHQQYTHSHRAAGYIHPDHRWYVNTGSFYRLYEPGKTGYAEMAEYDPLELGFAVVKIRNRQIQDIERVVLSN